MVELRNPHATRPWQHVLEPLSGYISLASQLTEDMNLHGEAFNFGPKSQQNKSVLELVVAMQKNWNKVKFKDISDKIKGPYESGLLKLNCDKALHLLGWNAIMDFNQTVEFTSEWYKSYYSGKEMELFTTNQIHQYIEIGRKKI